MDVFVEQYRLPEVDRREWFRYMGVRKTTPELELLADSCLREAETCFAGRVCYCQVPVARNGDTVDLTVWRGESCSLADRLEHCDRAVIFAATVGLEIDRLIKKYSRTSPARALCLQALGTERIEALCDVFCEELKERMQKSGNCVTSRFSPGYGDLPLSVQRDIFRFLECSRLIGIALNDSLLMSPTKSVTAIVGIGKDRK